jgi:CubicO group peptidase (beta-lactamase class C family)
VRDYARLGQLVLEDGRGIVSEAWVAGLGVGDPEAWRSRDWPGPEDDDGAEGYGRKWWTQDGRVAARGIHGQWIMIDRSSRTVIATFSSWPDAMSDEHTRAQRCFADAVIAAL